MSSWIKMNHSLRTNPKTARVAAALQVPRAYAIGALCVAWMFADEHSTGDMVEGMTKAMLDEEAGAPGLADAMEAVGWLTEVDIGLVFADFQEHNGSTAKARAQAASRQSKRRVTHERDRVSRTTVTGCHGRAHQIEKKEEIEKKERKKVNAATWSRDAGWCVPSSTMGGWSKAFDRVDIAGELARMDTWLRANPAKARKRNWERFVTNWLGRTQETAPPRANVTDDDVMAAMAELDANRRRVES